MIYPHLFCFLTLVCCARVFSLADGSGFISIIFKLSRISRSTAISFSWFLGFPYACAHSLPPVQYMIQIWSKYDSNRLREKVRRADESCFTSARTDTHLHSRYWGCSESRIWDVFYCCFKILQGHCYYKLVWRPFTSSPFKG